MGQYVNPGNESFASAALYSQIYVDKTGMLEYMNRVINSEQRYLCVSRPRRFGKSITARMIAAYYSKGCDSFELFEGLRIAGSQNFKEYTMASPKGLEEYVGFTQNEVQDLCEKYHMDFEEAKRWYDGCGFKSFSHIYCPNSVINAMLDGEYHNYWTGTVAYESLKLYITMDKDGLKNAITRLLSGDRYKVNVEAFENDMTKINSRDDVLTILIHLGYLAYDDSRKEAYIPNEEVRKAFTWAVEGTDWTPVIEEWKS